MNPYTESELDTFRLLQPLIQVSQGSENAQPSPYCSVRVIFMCLGVAKVHQESIPEQLGNMPIVALDDFRTASLIGTDHIPVLFGVELAGESSGVHQITKH